VPTFDALTDDNAALPESALSSAVNSVGFATTVLTLVRRQRLLKAAQALLAPASQGTLSLPVASLNAGVGVDGQLDFDLTARKIVQKTAGAWGTPVDLQAPAGAVSSTDITDSTALGRSLITASSSTSARTAIGAGTGNSNLAVGTAATDAKAGNYQPTAANISDSTTTGRALITAATAAAALSTLGAAADTAVAHKATAETVTGVWTFTASPVVPTPTAAGQASPKSYVDGAVAAVTASLNSFADYPVTVPEGMISPLSLTGISTQVVNGFRSTKVMDKGVAGQAISVNHAIGIAIPTGWNTFTLEADIQLFGNGSTGSTDNTIRCSLTCVQYDDPGFPPTLPTHVWQNATVATGSQTSIVVTSTTSITRTGPRCNIYFARDPQAAVGAGDTFGSRLLPVSFRLIWVS
jgi:hypothetical protein